MPLWMVATLAGARPASAACDGTPLRSARINLESDGLTRSFIVRAPADYDGRTAAPVVFAFHPFGMNGDYMAVRAPISRTWREAIALYPNGAPGARGSLAPSWQAAAGDLDDRDLRFFDAMLAWVRAHACVDDARVFVLGYSNGAQFSYLLACERGSAIAALAIASGRLACRPAQPKAVILSHGTRDSTIAFDAAISAAAAWTSVNGCKAPPQAAVEECVMATDCAAAPVTLCTYDGGHEYNAPFTARAVEFFKATKQSGRDAH